VLEVLPVHRVVKVQEVVILFLVQLLQLEVAHRQDIAPLTHLLAVMVLVLVVVVLVHKPLLLERLDKEIMVAHLLMAVAVVVVLAVLDFLSREVLTTALVAVLEFAQPLQGKEFFMLVVVVVALILEDLVVI
jgi:hypothetical protein